MTVLDKSIPYYPVLMVLNEDHPTLEVTLSPGYHFIPYDDTYRKAWVQLHVALGQLASYEEGMRYFEETFAIDMGAMKKQCVLVVDDKGNLAGTSSIWAGNHFGIDRYRVHWVGVDPKHQRKGLAKALMIKTISMYEQMHQTTPLYLTTQTNSYVAIQLYLQLGFIPYLGLMPVNFHAAKETFSQDNEKAWEIIMDKLQHLAN